MILLRSEIFDLTRFPVSDGAGIKGGAHCRYFLFLVCVSEIKNIFFHARCQKTAFFLALGV